uniref:DDE Tnp4 domain-containing protein n=1 Tax=Solanum lycopersicum TaxID=4081 RepID=K4CSM7_SOLLC
MTPKVVAIVVVIAIVTDDFFFQVFVVVLVAVKEYSMSYYLADGIYHKWSTIVQTICDPHSQKKKYLAMKQESCLKNVERAFRVLQSYFAIIAGPSHFLRKNLLHDIMTTCIILLNIIIEDERDLNTPIQDVVEASTPTIEIVVDENL